MITETEMDDVVREWMHESGPADGEGWPELRARLSVTRQARPWRMAIWGTGGLAGDRRPLVVALCVVLAIGLAAAMIVAGAFSTTPAPETGGFAPGSIVFTRGTPPSEPYVPAQDRKAAIPAATLYVAAPDGTGPIAFATDVRVSADELGAFYAVAPDRRAVAYLSDADGIVHLVIRSADGRVIGSFTGGPDTTGWETGPDPFMFSWAPDGQRLAVFSPDDASELVIISTAGQRLASIAVPDSYTAEPAIRDSALPWSRDGRWIAVPGCATGPECNELPHYLLLATDGSGSHLLPADPIGTDGGKEALAWGSGTRLAVSLVGANVSRVDLMSSDGSAPEPVNLTSKLDASGLIPNEAWRPLAWSPDGTRLAVAGFGPDGTGGGSGRLVVIEPDGSVQDLVTNPDGVIVDIAWSPDGRTLQYTAQGTRSTSLWSVEADGGTPGLLVYDFSPLFQVAGSPQ